MTAPQLSKQRSKLPKERRVNVSVLRQFLSNVPWKRWQRLMKKSGVSPRQEPRDNARTLSLHECSKVMEAWYDDVGAYRLKRWTR